MTHKTTATGIVKDPQPVDRLTGILARVAGQDHESMAAIWGRLLYVEPQAKELWPALLDLDAVVSKVEDQVRSHPSIDPEEPLRALTEFRATYFLTNLDNNFASRKQLLMNATKDMKFVASMVGRLPSVEKVIPKTDLDSLSSEITRIMEMIVNDQDIPTEVAQVLLQLAHRMREAIRAYQIFGLTPMEKALGETMSQLFYNPKVLPYTPLVPEDQQKTSESTSAFMNVFKKYGIVVSTANSAIGILKASVEFGKFLLGLGEGR